MRPLADVSNGVRGKGEHELAAVSGIFRASGKASSGCVRACLACVRVRACFRDCVSVCFHPCECECVLLVGVHVCVYACMSTYVCVCPADTPVLAKGTSSGAPLIRTRVRHACGMHVNRSSESVGDRLLCCVVCRWYKNGQQVVPKAVELPDGRVSFPGYPISELSLRVPAAFQ